MVSSFEKSWDFSSSSQSFLEKDFHTISFDLKFRKFWTRNRPGDRMRDKYNLNVLPTGFEDDYGKFIIDCYWWLWNLDSK